jgi:hypothetical protein
MPFMPFMLVMLFMPLEAFFLTKYAFQILVAFRPLQTSLFCLN